MHTKLSLCEWRVLEQRVLVLAHRALFVQAADPCACKRSSTRRSGGSRVQMEFHEQVTCSNTLCLCRMQGPTACTNGALHRSTSILHSRTKLHTNSGPLACARSSICMNGASSTSILYSVKSSFMGKHNVSGASCMSGVCLHACTKLHLRERGHLCLCTKFHSSE